MTTLRKRPELRDYQRKARAGLEAAWASGKRKLLLVAPTGSGKTTCAADLIEGAAAKGTPTLFVAHSKELIGQASTRLTQFGLPHGIIKSGVPATPGALVQVASIQTLVRREAPPAGLIVFDEAHRALAAQYEKIRENYPNAVIIGLTATPIRLDGRGLGDVFEELVECAKVEDLVSRGVLMRPRVFAPSTPDLKGVGTSKGDYHRLKLASAMDKPHLVGDIVETWHRLGGGQRTIVFAASVAHSRSIREAFRAAGVAAEHIDGQTPDAERDAILAGLAAGTVTVVCNYGILAEGYDCPAAAVCVLARPTKSLGLYLQMVGRVLRPDEASGKTEAIVLDHAGCALTHGLPTTPRHWGLDATPAKEKAPSVRQCTKCYAVAPGGTAVCPECGASYPAPKREAPTVRTRAGELLELTEEQLMWRGQPVKPVSHWRREHPSVRGKSAAPADQAALLRALAEYGAQRGYKPTWAAMQFSLVAGFFPDATVRKLATAPAEQAAI